MSVTVTVPTRKVETSEYTGWDTACGWAVSYALRGAESVVLQDHNGAQFYINAEEVEDNS
jgi:hypothetical protein